MKLHSVLILGRQPALGRAELESLLGAEHVQPLSDHTIGSDVASVRFERLGGSTRLARPIDFLHTTNWTEISRQLPKVFAKVLPTLPSEGKIKLGLSVIDMDAKPKQLFGLGLELKKVCKQHGRSVRLVPNGETIELNTAQVLHNNLTGELGVEIVLIQTKGQTLVAQTTAVQDIAAYAKRDQGRPKRDARVGMLPPKLAQVIVNLAAGQTGPEQGAVVLDPFCGTGVVLQEATLMGYDVYGTDLEPRMIEYTDANLQWLQQSGQTRVTTHSADGRYFKLEVGDATNHRWAYAPHIVACETYLGRPLSKWPASETLQDIIGACNVIIEKFLRNIYDQLAPGARLCLALPCWKSPNDTFYHLPLLDHLGQMGYNRIRFEYAEARELIYYRPNQIVARELLIITRK